MYCSYVDNEFVRDGSYKCCVGLNFNYLFTENFCSPDIIFAASSLIWLPKLVVFIRLVLLVITSA